MNKIINNKLNLTDITLVFFIFLKTGVFKSNEITESLSLIIFVSFSFFNIIKRRKLVINIQLKFYGLFTMFCCLSYFWALNRSYTLKPMITVVALLIFLAALSNNINTKEDLLKIIKYVVISNVVVSLKILALYWIYEGSAASRIKSITGIYFNTIGQVIGFSIFFSLYLYKYYNSKKYLFFSILQFTAVLLTTSRKSILIPVLGIFIILFLEKKFLKILKYIIVVSLFIFILNRLDSNISNTFATKFSELIKYTNGLETDDYSINLRSFFIETGKNIFRSYPFWGIGINNFSYYIADYTSYIEPRYSHNNFIELISCLGIVGFCLYYYSYIYILIKLVNSKLKNRENEFLTISISVILDLLIMEWGIVSYSGCLYHIFIMLIYYTEKYQKELSLRFIEEYDS